MLLALLLVLPLPVVRLLARPLPLVPRAHPVSPYRSSRPHYALEARRLPQHSPQRLPVFRVRLLLVPPILALLHSLSVLRLARRPARLVLRLVR